MGKIEQYLTESIDKKGKLLFTLIDPLDYASPEKAIKTGLEAAEAGADAILVGGSIGVHGPILDQVCSEIKQGSNVPVILFPGNIGTVSRYADAIYFMSLLNSRSPYWISQAQMLAALAVKGAGIEPLSTAYLLVEPGGTAGWVGDVNLIPRNKPKVASLMALAAEYMGFRFVLTDAGSNPANGHIPLEMVKAVSSVISIPYIVGGGIRTPEDARNITKAGADIIQIGTVFEKEGSTEKKVKGFLNAIRG